MRFKPTAIVISVVIALLLLAGSCSAGFVAGRAWNIAEGSPWLKLPGEGVVPTSEDGSETAGSGSEGNVEQLFVPFWQAWEVIQEQYVEQPVDQDAMMRGAIRGMLEALGDDHTYYMDPEMFEKATAELEGQEYEGIGAWVDTSQDYLTIISPIPGSPAEKAGLKPNDKVIAIDGKDMTAVEAEAARQLILGPKGTKVRLTILREGMEPFDVEIIRASIIVPTVSSKMLEDDIAYIRLYIFGADTTRDLRAALKELMAQKPRGLILDLRFNGGGYLDTAIEVVSQFIDSGVVMYEVYGDGKRIAYEAEEGGLATEIPLVVLVNEGSASASEIVAGAIQDRDRGKLVGVTTFGKGSVQSRFPLKNNQGAISVTIAHWLTPNNRQIDDAGLEPDYLVEITDEDIAAGIDPQLEKAIELLKLQQSTSGNPRFESLLEWITGFVYKATQIEGLIW